MKTRGVVVVVALALAGLAAGAVFMYLRGIQEDTQASQERVSVVVAKEDIPPGTELNAMVSEGMFTTALVPRKNLIRGVVTNLSQLQGQETSSAILAGEQISTTRLSGQAEFGGGVLGIPPGYRALTLQLEVPRAVGGVPKAGDHVSVYATFPNAGRTRATIRVDETGTSATARGTIEAVPGMTVTVVPDAQVLAVAGGEASTSVGSSSSAGDSKMMVTLALQPTDVQRVIFSEELAQVWLSLLAPNETGTEEAPVSFLEVAE